MKKHNDITGVFEDFNFKLIVVNSLLDEEPSFEDELERMKEKYTDNYDLYNDEGPIEEMLQYFEELYLTKEDLSKITSLTFDGGNDIYSLIWPNWDGEDDFFDVESVDGFQSLRNLERIEYTGMCEEEILDPFADAEIEIE